MPKLAGNEDDPVQQYAVGGSNFNFTATRIGDLGATKYTLATIVVDTTGSTGGFTDQLREMLVTAVKACKKSPLKDFMMVRVVLFSTSYPNGVREIHGFKRVLDINTDDYPKLVASGATPLWDATYEAVGALAEYGADLTANDFNVNGIVFVITDGIEGDWTNEPVSTVRPAQIADKLSEISRHEMLESLVSILIGINTDGKINGLDVRQELERFRSDVGFTQYTDAGDATVGSLAKLAAFVIQSISSQSQAIGTGGPSQSIAATI
jgi:hypothetical protein